MRELENKIQKSTFIEEANCIIIEIQIGLTIINEITLIIEEKEKNKDEIINELLQNKEELEKIINELKNQIAEKDERIKETEKFKKFKEEKEKAKKEESELESNFM